MNCLRMIEFMKGTYYASQGMPVYEYKQAIHKYNR